MKAILFTFFAFLAVSTLADRNLRKKSSKSAAKKKDWDNSFYQGVTLQIGHVKGDEPIDHSAISLAFAKAYNDVHEKMGYKVNDLTISTEVAVPEDPEELHGKNRKLFWSNWEYYNIWGFTDWSCRLCLDDDDYSYGQRNWWRKYLPPVSFVQSSGDMHQAFETKFCDYLHEAGFAFAEANHCKVEFTYSAASIEEAVDLAKTPVTPNYRLGSQITLSHVDGHVNGDIEAETGVLTEAFITAYNQVHKSIDDKVTGANLLRMLDEKSEGSDFINRHIWFDITTNDEMLPPIETLFTDNLTHDIFEKALCAKLKESGLPTFAKLSGCNVAFSYSSENAKVNELSKEATRVA